MAAPPPPPSREHRRTLSAHPPQEIVKAHEEHVEEEIPTPLENGVEITEQTAAPNHYRWYTATVEGGN